MVPLNVRTVNCASPRPRLSAERVRTDGDRSHLRESILDLARHGREIERAGDVARKEEVDRAAVTGELAYRARRRRGRVANVAGDRGEASAQNRRRRDVERAADRGRVDVLRRRRE